ncbi:MAG: DUF3887 domain-containing protein [Lachnospiraceae bacterium]|nr:DUF3887 domain-containing protein [Lachnospiraceae bacterium]
MNAKRYVRYIVKELKCSSRRRREVRKELLAKVTSQSGETLSYDELRKEIGEIYDVINEYNDGMSAGEKKKYKTEHTIRVLIPVLLFISILIGGIIFILPHKSDISSGRYFTESALTERLQKDITLLNKEDYEALRAGSTEAMKAILVDGLMASIRQKTGSDWGAFVSTGEPQCSDVLQYGKHLAECEVTVTYENRDVLFRITYDSEMKLTALYVR